jgi:predicted glycosyltransferase
MQAPPPRILFSSNELVGLGHLRVVLRIAGSIQAELVDASMLVLTASQMAHAFPLPKGLDVIQIPGVCRSNEGVDGYRPLRLQLPFEQVKKLRERIIGETARTFRPDLFLVDYRPGGVEGELLPTLRELKRQGGTALVLLLRDIVDDPEFVRIKWRTDLAMEALEYYDEIWVYGCQNLYDPIREYQLPAEVSRKIRFCGYLDIEAPVLAAEHVLGGFGITTGMFVLVTIGNGSCGANVLDAYVRALDLLPDKLDVFSLLVGGPALPKMQRDIIRQQCEAISSKFQRRRVHFADFMPHLIDHMAAADLVISRGGYNTTTEILMLGKRAIVVPHKSFQNEEQVIRASLLESLGLIRTIQPDHLSPERLAKTMLEALNDSPPTRRHLRELGFRLDGLDNINNHVKRLLNRGATP